MLGITPLDPQGDPFDPVNSFPGDGRVLIGQFSTVQGFPITGTMLLQVISNGQVEQHYVSFINDKTCTDDLECTDGDPCNGEELCVDGQCLAFPPSPDCNGNGVLDSCDIANGTSTDANGNGVPDDCDVLCAADIDNDGMVGINDFLDLLAAWGPCK